MNQVKSRWMIYFFYILFCFVTGCSVVTHATTVSQFYSYIYHCHCLGTVERILYGSIFSNLALIFTTAWFTHHVRDATRRGLWFAPFGSTPTLPCTLYVAIIVSTTLLMRTIMLYRRQELLPPSESTEEV